MSLLSWVFPLVAARHAGISSAEFFMPAQPWCEDMQVDVRLKVLSYCKGLLENCSDDGGMRRNIMQASSCLCACACVVQKGSSVSQPACLCSYLLAPACEPGAHQTHALDVLPECLCLCTPSSAVTLSHTTSAVTLSHTTCICVCDSRVA